MKQPRASLFWMTSLFVIASFCLYSVDVAGDEPAVHSVKERSHSKALTDGGTEDAPAYEQLAPHAATEVGGKWHIRTLSLTPPGEREFRAFGSGRFFDVIPDNPGGTGPIIHDNESTKIGITQPFPLAAKDGDTFPLMLDGNFKTGGGGGPGGGTATFPVWGGEGSQRRRTASLLRYGSGDYGIFPARERVNHPRGGYSYLPRWHGHGRCKRRGG